MTLEVDSWAISGAESSARIARLQLQSATSSGNGVLTSDALEVTELDVPGGAVDVAAGGFVAFGQEAIFQGSYFGFNVGSAEVSINPTDSSGSRSDLVILRVEDPNIDGTSWSHDPATDQLYHFRVIEDVGSTATELPANTTGVVLARIDIPSSTATITQDLITDLRELAQPRRQRILRVQRGGTQSDGTNWDKAGNITANYERWPQFDWVVTIPPWATQLQILAEWSNVFLEPTGDTAGTEDARGLVKIWVDDNGGNTIDTTPSAYNINQVSSTNGYRCSLSNRDQIDVPEVLRGATVDVRMYVQGTEGQDGRLVGDEYANFSVDIEALEVPAGEAGP